jgi:hypothetical protein
VCWNGPAITAATASNKAIKSRTPRSDLIAPGRQQGGHAHTDQRGHREQDGADEQECDGFVQHEHAGQKNCGLLIAAIARQNSATVNLRAGRSFCAVSRKMVSSVNEKQERGPKRRRDTRAPTGSA